MSFIWVSVSYTQSLIGLICSFIQFISNNSHPKLNQRNFLIQPIPKSTLNPLNHLPLSSIIQQAYNPPPKSNPPQQSQPTLHPKALLLPIHSETPNYLLLNKWAAFLQSNTANPSLSKNKQCDSA